MSGYVDGWCDECQNTGWTDCFCGGDICICENNGEQVCPVCGGAFADRGDDAEFDEP